MTAGGMTQVPTSQSVMAKLRTKQFVTVRRRRVVTTAKITRVLPTTVTNISSINMTTTSALDHAMPTRYESIDGVSVGAAMEDVVTAKEVVDDDAIDVSPDDHV